MSLVFVEINRMSAFLRRYIQTNTLLSEYLQNCVGQEPSNVLERTRAVQHHPLAHPRPPKIKE